MAPAGRCAKSGFDELEPSFPAKAYPIVAISEKNTVVRLRRRSECAVSGVTRLLSESSVHHLHAILSAALNQGVKWGWIETSPAKRTSPPPLRSKIPTIPTPEQLNQLYVEANRSDATLATAIALAALTGARPGALCALRWSDLDLEARRVRIARSLTIVKKQLHEGPTKTHQTRDVALDATGVGILETRQAYMLALSEAAASPLVADPYVLSDAAHGRSEEHTS